MLKPLSDWDRRYLGLAQHVAQWSKDPSTKVGAVAVGETKNLLAAGFNGVPPGIADDARLENREWKYEHVVHAELNALFNATFPVHELFVTQPCCHRCAVHILAKRTVKRIVAIYTPEFMSRWHKSVSATENVFMEAGVEFLIYPKEEVLP
jgi:dCMP deaminase